MTTATASPGRGARLTTTRPTHKPATLDELLDRHRAAVLRDAAATLTVLDWKAYTDGRTLHVLDARDLGAPARGYLGFTAGAQLHELAHDLLPPRATTHAVAAVAVNADAIVLCPRLQQSPGALDGDQLGRLRAAVAAVAAHELAHVVDAQATGRRLPPGATLDQVVRSLSDGRAVSPSHQNTIHGPAWVRGYCHLVARAAWTPHHDQWLAAFRRDVAAVLPHDPHKYLDALAAELESHSIDDPLVEIIRTPAPAGFLALFDSQPAKEET